MAKSKIPGWAEEMRSVFRSGAVSQFILHGAIFDLVPFGRDDGSTSFLPLKGFLEDVMLPTFDAIVLYDRSSGIQVRKGLKEFTTFLKSYDEWNGTAYQKGPATVPRDPRIALSVLDRFLDWGAGRTVIENNELLRKPLRVAILVDYAQFIVPRGDGAQISGTYGDAVIRLIDWSSDPAIVEARALTILLTENVNDLHQSLSDNPYSAKIGIKLPTVDELAAFTTELLRTEAGLKDKLALKPEVLAQRSVGLSRVNLRNALQYAVRNDLPVNSDYLVKKRRELIEKECRDLLDFIESPFTLDNVAGHKEVKAWLREDAELIKNGSLRSVPMGYLLCGRIGTGKTFVTSCWAGEIGIPCVVFKNFRDKWQGSTEGNLEKIFEILKALGQVMVFIDEADQATGKRDGGQSDSGTSGRIYAMLAKEMSNTLNRGKIIWIFATSRPDLVEVDLKRQGRLDVHIPLFPPQTEEERAALFKSMAKKLGVPSDDLPALPAGTTAGGNEMEAMIVRASREYDLHSIRKGKKKRAFATILADVIADFRPMAHTAQLEYMDLVAVKECTDTRFLPEQYKAMPLEEIEERLSELKLRIGG